MSTAASDEPTIVTLDPSDEATAARIVEIQQSAYAVEAEIIGFDAIPPLHETAEIVMTLTDLTWRGVVVDGAIVAVIGWVDDGDAIDIDRLAVDQSAARRGHGRRLVQDVPTDRPAIVSTGAGNEPAERLYLGEGFADTGRVEVVPGFQVSTFRRGPVGVRGGSDP